MIQRSLEIVKLLYRLLLRLHEGIEAELSDQDPGRLERVPNVA